MKWSPDECNCAVTCTLFIVGGKWKWLILYKLWHNGVQRYGSLWPSGGKRINQS